MITEDGGRCSVGTLHVFERKVASPEPIRVDRTQRTQVCEVTTCCTRGRNHYRAKSDKCILKTSYNSYSSKLKSLASASAPQTAVQPAAWTHARLVHTATQLPACPHKQPVWALMHECNIGQLNGPNGSALSTARARQCTLRVAELLISYLRTTCNAQ